MKIRSLLFLASMLLLAPLLVFADNSRQQTFRSIGSFQRDLTFGMTNNPEVTKLQSFLKEMNFLKEAPSGNYFFSTFFAVLAFQQANGITPPAGNSFGPQSRAKANLIISDYLRSIVLTPISTPAPVTTPAVVAPIPNLPPIAPSGAQAITYCSTGGSSSVDVFWNDNSDNETGFEVQRSTDPGYTLGLTTFGQNLLPANIKKLTDGTTLPSTTYFYRVRSCKAGLCSSYVMVNDPTSNSRAVLTKSCAAPVTSPVTPTITPLSPTPPVVILPSPPPLLPPPPATLTVTSPNGGETYQQGETISIKWASSGLSADSTVTITMPQEGTTFGLTLLSGTPNDGQENLIVPVTVNPGKYRILIKCLTTFTNTCSAVDFSDAAFSIMAKTQTPTVLPAPLLLNNTPIPTNTNTLTTVVATTSTSSPANTSTSTPAVPFASSPLTSIPISTPTPVVATTSAPLPVNISTPTPAVLPTAPPNNIPISVASSTPLSPSNTSTTTNPLPPVVNSFSISVSPASASVVQGESSTGTVTASYVRGNVGGVVFVVSGLPAGAVVNFSPEFCDLGTIVSCSTDFVIRTSLRTLAGTRTITIKGISISAGTQSSNTQLTVVAKPADVSSPKQPPIPSGGANTSTKPAYKMGLVYVYNGPETYNPQWRSEVGVAARKAQAALKTILGSKVNPTIQIIGEAKIDTFAWNPAVLGVKFKQLADGKIIYDVLPGSGFSKTLTRFYNPDQKLISVENCTDCEILKEGDFTTVRIKSDKNLGYDNIQSGAKGDLLKQELSQKLKVNFSDYNVVYVVFGRTGIPLASENKFLSWKCNSSFLDVIGYAGSTIVLEENSILDRNSYLIDCRQEKNTDSFSYSGSHYIEVGWQAMVHEILHKFGAVDVYETGTALGAVNDRSKALEFDPRTDESVMSSGRRSCMENGDLEKDGNICTKAELERVYVDKYNLLKMGLIAAPSPVQSSSPPYITVVSPNGGERWELGAFDPVSIKWKVNGAAPANWTVDPNGIPNVFIELYKGSQLVKTLQTNLSGRLDLDINVPQVPSGNDYKIRISRDPLDFDSKYFDFSDRPFSIVAKTQITQTLAPTATPNQTPTTTAPAPVLDAIPTATPAGPGFKIAFPISGSRVELGKTYTIQWSSASNTGNLSTVGVSLIRSDGSRNYFFDSIATDIPNAGSYQWKVPTYLDLASDYYIRLYNLNYPNDVALSGPFSIAAAGTSANRNNRSFADVFLSIGYQLRKFLKK